MGAGAPKRADDALQRKDVQLVARIPGDAAELRRVLLEVGDLGEIRYGQPLHMALSNGIADMDNLHPLLNGVELPEPTVWPRSLAFANIDSNHEKKCRILTELVIRNMDTMEAVRDEILNVLGAVKFQSSQ